MKNTVNALVRSASRDPRCAPRACGASRVGGRPRRPCHFWVRHDVGWVTERRIRLGRWFVTARPARRVPPSASLATDHSGRAGALRTARARSGLKKARARARDGWVGRCGQPRLESRGVGRRRRV